MIKPVSVPSTPKSEHKRLHQTFIKQWCRSKSELGLLTGGPTAASGHTSSDDFPDVDMVDVIDEISKYHDGLDPVQTNDHKKYEVMLSDDDVFETPPTTRPPSNKAGVGLGIGLDKQFSDPRSFFPPKTELAGITNKKRPCSDAQPMKPPPMRRVSREKPDLQSDVNSAVPTPPPDVHGFSSRSLDLSRSFDNISTVSSSMTSASPAWTSPNTSFCSESLATSFESTAEETDTTIRPSFSRGRSRYPSDQSSLWSIGRSKDDRRKLSNVSLCSAAPAQSFPAKRSEEITELQGVTETSTMTDLAKRLTSKSPFGIPIHVIIKFLVSADASKLPSPTILQLFPFHSSTKSYGCHCMVN